MSKLKKRSDRKLAAASRKLRKAKAIRKDAKNYSGKKAGAMRTRAARKERRATEKVSKAAGLPTKKAEKKNLQKQYGKTSKSDGRKTAKIIKLKKKRAALEGSPRRTATRSKHLGKRMTKIGKRLSWNK
jgi:hypothetical protein